MSQQEEKVDVEAPADQVDLWETVDRALLCLKAHDVPPLDDMLCCHAVFTYLLKQMAGPHWPGVRQDIIDALQQEKYTETLGVLDRLAGEWQAKQ